LMDVRKYEAGRCYGSLMSEKKAGCMVA